MSLVSVHNEWDPLEEIIVGTAIGARIPLQDRGLFAVSYADFYDRPEQIPSGAYCERVIQETEEDLEELTAELRKLGIVVRRPDPIDYSHVVSTPDWKSDGMYSYCPRDLLLAIGDTVIETPMPLRSRFLESAAYKSILVEYLESGSRWLSAPKPRLLDSMYVIPESGSPRLSESEPAFDAANVLRSGRDLIYLVSCSGNRIGGRWLQSVLGRDYRVHLCEDLYDSTHLDTTITLLRPGLALVNPERVSSSNLPPPLRSWDLIQCPQMVDGGFVGEQPYTSLWIGMNLLMIRPDLALVDKNQTPLIRALEKHAIEVLAMPLRHARTLGGSFHCVTLDVRRKGTLEDYAS